VSACMIDCLYVRVCVFSEHSQLVSASVASAETSTSCVVLCMSSCVCVCVRLCLVRTSFDAC